MERQLILDLFTGVLAFMVLAFLWVGLFLGRKSVDWDNNHEAVGYIFICLVTAVLTATLSIKAWFWFTEHIIYIP